MELWDKVEQKLRCLRAVSRAEVDDAQRFLLANVVETYLRLTPEHERRFTAEIDREANEDPSLLKRQLGRRFGELPAWVDDRLEQASREELESWAERVLDAERLEDVFGSE